MVFPPLRTSAQKVVLYKLLMCAAPRQLCEHMSAIQKPTINLSPREIVTDFLIRGIRYDASVERRSVRQRCIGEEFGPVKDIV